MVMDETKQGDEEGVEARTDEEPFGVHNARALYIHEESCRASAQPVHGKEPRTDLHILVQLEHHKIGQLGMGC